VTEIIRDVAAIVIHCDEVSTRTLVVSQVNAA